MSPTVIVLYKALGYAEGFFDAPTWAPPGILAPALRWRLQPAVDKNDFAKL